MNALIYLTCFTDKLSGLIDIVKWYNWWFQVGRSVVLSDLKQYHLHRTINF